MILFLVREYQYKYPVSYFRHLPCNKSLWYFKRKQMVGIHKHVIPFHILPICSFIFIFIFERLSRIILSIYPFMGPSFFIWLRHSNSLFGWNQLLFPFVLLLFLVTGKNYSFLFISAKRWHQHQSWQSANSSSGGWRGIKEMKRFSRGIEKLLSTTEDFTEGRWKI